MAAFWTISKLRMLVMRGVQRQAQRAAMLKLATSKALALLQQS